jgi:hypothetical protein
MYPIYIFGGRNRPEAEEVDQLCERWEVTTIGLHHKEQEQDLQLRWLVRLEDHQVLETC